MEIHILPYFRPLIPFKWAFYGKMVGEHPIRTRYPILQDGLFIENLSEWVERGVLSVRDDINWCSIVCIGLVASAYH